MPLRFRGDDLWDILSCQFRQESGGRELVRMRLCCRFEPEFSAIFDAKAQQRESSAGIELLDTDPRLHLLASDRLNPGDCILDPTDSRYRIPGVAFQQQLDIGSLLLRELTLSNLIEVTGPEFGNLIGIPHLGDDAPCERIVAT